MVVADALEEQVAQILLGICLPDNWRAENHSSLGSYLQTDQRRHDLQRSLERLDFRWDMGFMEKADYLAKRKALQQQLQHNQPIVEQDLIEAERVLRQFNTDWVVSELVRRKQLLNMLVESVWLTRGTIKTIKLRPRFTYLARHAKGVEIDVEGCLVTQVGK
jgi:hypothetical protein